MLRAMRRRYTAAQYLAKLEPLADFNLTADVIVGFPGEDEDAFERTLEVVERAGITKVHVFPYSPRPGTSTAACDTVPAAVKKERSARLRALSDELCRRRWQQKLGTTDRCSSTGRGAATPTTTRPGSSRPTSVGSSWRARSGSPKEGILAVAA